MSSKPTKYGRCKTTGAFRDKFPKQDGLWCIHCWLRHIMGVTTHGTPCPLLPNSKRKEGKR